MHERIHKPRIYSRGPFTTWDPGMIGGMDRAIVETGPAVRRARRKDYYGHAQAE